MSTTANEIYLTVDGQRVALDLDEETQLLPTFQANDRTKPATIETSYTPELSVPASEHNTRLLNHAAEAQYQGGQPYRTMPALLLSDGVEVMPNALLSILGYSAGAYQLRLEALV